MTPAIARNQAFGRYLTKKRELVYKNKWDAGRRAGINPSRYSSLERGTVVIPVKLSEIDGIARVLDLDWREVLGVALGGVQ